MIGDHTYSTVETPLRMDIGYLELQVTFARQLSLSAVIMGHSLGSPPSKAFAMICDTDMHDYSIRVHRRDDFICTHRCWLGWNGPLPSSI